MKGKREGLFSRDGGEREAQRGTWERPVLNGVLRASVIVTGASSGIGAATARALGSAVLPCCSSAEMKVA